MWTDRVPASPDRLPTSSVASSVDVSRHDTLWGRQDRVLARIGQWADEDPAAIQRLLADPLLRRQVLDASGDPGSRVAMSLPPRQTAPRNVASKARTARHRCAPNPREMSFPGRC